MATTSSNPEVVYRDRERRSFFSFDAGAIALVLIQLVIGVGMIFALRQQVADLKEYTTGAIQRLETRMDKLTDEVLKRK